ncbi:MAG: GTP cyclohydrolase I [Myxococcota bacterium]|nr:GTP cyclohydrolase I [Myxococcota bacterium]
MPDPDLDGAARAIEAFLRAVGAPVGRDPELEGTGRRVAEAWAEDLLSGYADDPAEILADATASNAPGLVVVTDLATATMCPHHLMPAAGVVHVGYFPGERVVGFGALGRLVDCFARRLRLQEDLGRDIAEALVTHLGARGAGAVVDLAPTCMTARGDRRHASRATTLAFAGSMSEDPSLQQQLLSAIQITGRGEP